MLSSRAPVVYKYLSRLGPLQRALLQVPRHSSTLATFHYLLPLEEYQTVKPFHINVPQGGIPNGTHTNEVSGPYHNIPVHDMRGREDEFSLDRQGFQVIRDRNNDVDTVLEALSPKDYPKLDLVMGQVGPAMQNLLRKRLGAESVITFAFRFRRRHNKFPALPRGTDPNIAQPVQGVHGDFTPDYARTTARFIGRNIEDLGLQDRRWQIIRLTRIPCQSAWRPLFGPLYDWPLGVLDSTSLDYGRDLVASDNVYPHQVSETYNVFYHPDHRWHYLSEHQPHEFLLFKSFDSRTKDGVARVCAHAAFQLPSAPLDARARESIECVSLVLYPRGTADQRPEETLPSETPAHLEPVGAFKF